MTSGSSTTLMTFENKGPELVSTNYWHTEHAQRGYFYLSGNAGVYRLLVPPVMVDSTLPEMKTGRSVVIEPSIFHPSAWDIVFDDESPEPFSLTLMPEMINPLPAPGLCRLSVWTQAGKQLDLPCETRL